MDINCVFEDTIENWPYRLEYVIGGVAVVVVVLIEAAVAGSWLESSWLESSWLESSWLESSWLESSWLEVNNWLEENTVESTSRSDDDIKVVDFMTDLDAETIEVAFVGPWITPPKAWISYNNNMDFRCAY